VPSQTGFYSGPWDAIGVTQDEFSSMTGTAYTAVPASLKGLVYIDNDGIPQNQSGSWGITSTSGEGLLYVDGDLNLTGPFTYKGLVYIEGNLASSGHIWVLGAIVARGRSGVKLTGGASLLYSEEAIQLAISKF